MEHDIDLQTILDERSIYRQLVKLARAMDERDWLAFDQITTGDVVADFGTGTLQGREKMVATIRQYLDNCGTTQHMLANVAIDVDAEQGTATSQAYVADLHVGLGSRSDLTFRTMGIYFDTWCKRDGLWWLSQRTKDNRKTLGHMEVFSGP